MIFKIIFICIMISLKNQHYLLYKIKLFLKFKSHFLKVYLLNFRNVAISFNRCLDSVIGVPK